MARWVSIKLIDGDEKILRSIEKNLKVRLIENNKLQKEKEEIEDIIKHEGIQRGEIKDRLISSIIFMSEIVANDVITIDDE